MFNLKNKNRSVNFRYETHARNRCRYGLWERDSGIKQPVQQFDQKGTIGLVVTQHAHHIGEQEKGEVFLRELFIPDIFPDLGIPLQQG